MGKKKELLFRLTEDDFRFIAKRGSGKGGQKKNKTSSAIQCFHDPSGAMGEAEDAREQSQNKKLAFKRCCDTVEFRSWLKLKTDAAMGLVEIEETDETGKVVKRKLNHQEIK